MVASISNATSNLFSKLDTKNQGYIDKADLKAALSKSAKGGANASADTKAADKLFDQLDGNKDGKVTKSELSSAIDKLSSELNAQRDQGRVAKGGAKPPGGPPPGGGAGKAPAADAGSAQASPYNAAADTNGDGTVSADEAAAYAKQLASGATTEAPDKGLAKALQSLKAYASNDESGQAASAQRISVTA